MFGPMGSKECGAAVFFNGSHTQRLSLAGHQLFILHCK